MDVLLALANRLPSLLFLLGKPFFYFWTITMSEGCGVGLVVKYGQYDVHTTFSIDMLLKCAASANGPFPKTLAAGRAT